MNSGDHARDDRPGLLRRFVDLLVWAGFVALISWLTFAYVGTPTPFPRVRWRRPS